MSFRFDTAELRRSIQRAQPILRKSVQELTRTAAKGFVKDALKFTPPGSQKRTGIAAKKRGEKTIEADVNKLVIIAAKAAATAQAAGLRATHAGSRTARGRVRRKGGRLRVTAATARAVIAELKANVGLLASGWSGAAAELNVPIPAWIKRHGTRFSAVRVVETEHSIRIEISNTVPFLGSVDDFERRVAKFIEYQQNKLNRRAEHVLQKSLRRAGF